MAARMRRYAAFFYALCSHRDMWLLGVTVASETSSESKTIQRELSERVLEREREASATHSRIIRIPVSDTFLSVSQKKKKKKKSSYPDTCYLYAPWHRRCQHGRQIAYLWRSSPILRT
jgi:hypothetical protein